MRFLWDNCFLYARLLFCPRVCFSVLFPMKISDSRMGLVWKDDYDFISFNSSANVLGSEVLHQTMCCLVNTDSGSGGYLIEQKRFFKCWKKS